MLDGFLKGVFLGKESAKVVQLSVKTGLGNDMLFGSQPVGKKGKDCFVVHMYMNHKIWLQRLSKLLGIF